MPLENRSNFGRVGIKAKNGFNMQCCADVDDAGGKQKASLQRQNHRGEQRDCAGAAAAGSGRQGGPHGGGGVVVHLLRADGLVTPGPGRDVCGTSWKRKPPRERGRKFPFLIISCHFLYLILHIFGIYVIFCTFHILYIWYVIYLRFSTTYFFQWLFQVIFFLGFLPPHLNVSGAELFNTFTYSPFHLFGADPLRQAHWSQSWGLLRHPSILK